MQSTVWVNNQKAADARLTFHTAHLSLNHNLRKVIITMALWQKWYFWRCWQLHLIWTIHQVWTNQCCSFNGTPSPYSALRHRSKNNTIMISRRHSWYMSAYWQIWVPEGIDDMSALTNKPSILTMPVIPNTTYAIPNAEYTLSNTKYSSILIYIVYRKTIWQVDDNSETE